MFLLVKPKNLFWCQQILHKAAVDTVYLFPHIAWFLKKKFQVTKSFLKNLRLSLKGQISLMELFSKQSKYLVYTIFTISLKKVFCNTKEQLVFHVTLNCCKLLVSTICLFIESARKETDLIKVSHIPTVLCNTATEGETWKTRRRNR